MTQQAKRTCIGWDDQNQMICSHTPARNSDRCRPCQRLFRARTAPPDENGIKPNSCTCGRAGRVYLALLCNQCFVEEYALRLWKDAGYPDKQQPHVETARAEFKQLRQLWLSGEQASAEAQGTAILAGIRQRAKANAQRLANEGAAAVKAVNEIISRTNGRLAILTLSTDSSFTINPDGSIGDPPEIIGPEQIAAHLISAPTPVGILLRIFTGEASCKPFLNDPTKFLPVKELTACLYHESSIIPLPAEDTRQACGEVDDDVVYANW